LTIVVATTTSQQCSYQAAASEPVTVITVIVFACNA